MENKKDIGKAISNKLIHLNKSPNDQVWVGIQKELDKKKKRRGLLFWFFFSAILIGIITPFVYLYHFKSEKPLINNVIIPKSTGTSKVNFESQTVLPKATDSVHSNLNATKSNGAKFSNDNSKNTINNKSLRTSVKELGNSKNNKSVNKEWNTKTVTDSDKKSKIISLKVRNAKSKSKTETLTSNQRNSLKRPNTNNSKKSNYKKEIDLSDTDTSLPFENNKIKKNTKTTNQSNASFTISSSSEITVSNDLLKQNESNNSNRLDTSKTEKSKPLSRFDERKLKLEEIKKTNQKKRDSLVAAKKEEKKKKDLDKNVNEEKGKDSTKTEDSTSPYEITVAPYYGYNYTGNLGNGNFINNSKTAKKGSELNTSYGVLIRIMGSSKIGMQIGVGMINSVYSASFNKESNSFINENDVSLTVPLNELNQLFPNQTKVTSRQETTFIEVPLEAYYILSDNKFGMATSFGISFLKFNKNEVFLESESTNRMKIGSLENIAPFSSSINAKFHLFYKITSKLHFDLYPSFQYQFMGYKGVPNYHPYFISLKTGLSYKL